ncbi:MAG: fluoride efflux transporter CrcB [Phycisphaerales bacterium]|nr:fluoride efflux transporter CrcB [Phycisphaerales bacterium]
MTDVVDKVPPSLLVFLGAGLGGVLRFWVSESVSPPANGFPLATLLINAAGCLVIGCLVGAMPNMSSLTRLIVVVGLLGGFTTFSAFARETVDLWQAGRLSTAATYVLASNVLSIALAAAGFVVSRRLLT